MAQCYNLSDINALSSVWKRSMKRRVRVLYRGRGASCLQQQLQLTLPDSQAQQLKVQHTHPPFHNCSVMTSVRELTNVRERTGDDSVLVLHTGCHVSFVFAARDGFLRRSDCAGERCERVCRCARDALHADLTLCLWRDAPALIISFASAQHN